MSGPQRIKLRHLVPSVVTVFGMCAGLTSIRMSLEGNVETSLYFILLAVLLDAADGKLARILDCASPFGAELDSLGDFCNFGIAPGVLLYNTLYVGTQYASLGWLASLVLAVCCALRLARFNLSIRGPDICVKQSGFFVGVPAPALACLALMPVFLHLYGLRDADFPVWRTIYIIGTGLLAVSTLPTYSIKHISIKRAHLPPTLVGAAILVIFLLVYPWPTLIVLNIAYLASLPFSYRSFKRAQAGNVTPDEALLTTATESGVR